MDARVDTEADTEADTRVDARIESLYGAVDWARATGVLHVSAIAAADRSTILIGSAAPASPTDRFVLGIARARADAIVTTGAILRSEPELVHRYSEDMAEEEALRDWRARTLGRTEPPALIVLSRSGAFPTDHPALLHARSGFVWTSREVRDRLAGSTGSLTFEVPEDTMPLASDRAGASEGVVPRSNNATGLAAALATSLAKDGVETVSIEAGPSTTAELYRFGIDRAGKRYEEPTTRVDELMLSLFEGRLAAAARGPAFASRETIRHLFPDTPTRKRVDEQSGPWCFERYCRIESPQGAASAGGRSS